MPGRPRVPRVLVYLPTYDAPRVRALASELLPWCADATHWCPFVTPYPEPPQGG